MIVALPGLFSYLFFNFFSAKYRKGNVLFLFLFPFCFSSVLIKVINLFLCFRFDALTELGAFMRTESLCISEYVI